MALDEKVCWNLTWVAMDNVALGPLGILLGELDENNNKPWVPKNPTHSSMIF
jgi:hypothetical protein